MLLAVSGFVKSRPAAHSCTDSLVERLENRIPSSQFPVPAIAASFVPLSPSGELMEVQNGITFFPVKSFSLTKLVLY